MAPRQGDPPLGRGFHPFVNPSSRRRRHPAREDRSNHPNSILQRNRDNHGEANDLRNPQHPCHRQNSTNAYAPYDPDYSGSLDMQYRKDTQYDQHGQYKSEIQQNAHVPGRPDNRQHQGRNWARDQPERSESLNQFTRIKNKVAAVKSRIATSITRAKGGRISKLPKEKAKIRRKSGREWCTAEYVWQALGKMWPDLVLFKDCRDWDDDKPSSRLQEDSWVGYVFAGQHVGLVIGYSRGKFLIAPCGTRGGQ